jgi:hypothetical protein
MSSKNPRAGSADATSGGAKPSESPKPSGGPKPSSDRKPPVTNNVTGRVRFDERGNAVWEWAVSTGSFGNDVSTSRLRKLENASLSISSDEPPPVPAERPVKIRKAATHEGYSPYDSGLLVKAKAEVQRAKKKDLKRLGEWLKLREMANRNKQND